MRRPVDDRRYGSFVVGLERRLVAFASDDALWSRRRQVTMAEIAVRLVWLRDARPAGLDELVHTVTELYASA